MVILVKFLKVQPTLRGQNIKGSWSKQNLIIETIEDYPKKVCISVWNNKVDVSRLKIGKKYEFYCNVESKEYKEKWYTEISLWKINELVEDSLAKKENLNYTANHVKFNDEPDFPDADIDELRRKAISFGTGMNLNEFLQRKRTAGEFIIDKDPGLSATSSKSPDINIPDRLSNMIEDSETSSNENFFTENEVMEKSILDPATELSNTDIEKKTFYDTDGLKRISDYDSVTAGENTKENRTDINENSSEEMTMNMNLLQSNIENSSKIFTQAEKTTNFENEADDLNNTVFII